MYDSDMDEASWKALKRAMKYLFKTLYGAWPSLKVYRVKGDDLIRYNVIMTAPANAHRPPVRAQLMSSSKMACFTGILSTMSEKLDDAQRDWDEDEWYVRPKEED